MRKKNYPRCPLCHAHARSVLVTIRRTRVFECTDCEIGISERTIATKRQLYHTKKHYSFTNAQATLEKYLWKFERILLVLRAYVTSGRIVDVGSGFGLFPKLLATNPRYKVTALEPYLTLQFLKNDRRVEIRKSTFRNYTGTPRSLAAITFLDVLEHFPDPRIQLQKANRLLKRNGYVFILAPNYKSVMRSYADRWAWWMLEDHHVHFSHRSLKKALTLSGFKLVYLDTFEHPQDMWLQLKSNFGSIGNPMIRRLVKGAVVPLMYLAYLLLRPLIWRMYGGGLLFAVARKKHA